MSNRCLYCYQPLENGMNDFHPWCSKIFFGSENQPVLDISNDQIQELAKEIVSRSIAVTGVQPKLSLTIEAAPGDPKRSRFTIVGLWGHYILKPATPEFASLPENEDLTMHLCDHFGLLTAEHSLIRLQSGELAYITKRFDRQGEEKLALEDMCQLTETLTNDKYRSSHEKIGKFILKFSTNPGLEAIHFFERTLFCYLTGNADMHLKNFSMLTTKDNEVIFSPGYDLLCTRIAIPEDKEEMALTINGRKRKLKKSDFDALAENLKIPGKTVQNIYSRFSKRVKYVNNWVDNSFLSGDMKEQYKEVVQHNATQIGL